jgi:hypothetical protein
LAENGRMESQDQSVSGYILGSCTNASHIFGFLAGSMRSLAERVPKPKPSPPGEGGIQVPLRMASSTMRRWRLRMRRERRMIAAETERRRTSVARKVYTVKGSEWVTKGRVKVPYGREMQTKQGKGCCCWRWKWAKVLQWRTW